MHSKRPCKVTMRWSSNWNSHGVKILSIWVHFLPQLSFHEIVLKFSYNMYILIRITSELELEYSFKINWNPWPVTVAFVSHCPLVLYFPVFVIRIWAFCLPQKNIFFSMLLLLPWLICFVVYVILYAPLVPHLS